MSVSLLTARRTMLKVKKQVIDWTGRSGQTYFHHRVAEYREMWRAIAAASGASWSLRVFRTWHRTTSSPKAMSPRSIR